MCRLNGITIIHYKDNKCFSGRETSFSFLFRGDKDLNIDITTTTQEEVTSATKLLKTNNSLGSDHISHGMFKIFNEENLSLVISDYILI